MASDYSIAYSDEFSIGLQAFNEALDAYQSDKGASFLYFAKMVINRRVIDYIRKIKNSTKNTLSPILKLLIMRTTLLIYTKNIDPISLRSI